MFIPFTVTPTSSPGPWPPDVDFSSVFFSDEVYCCLHTASTKHMSITTSSTVDPGLQKTLSYTKKSLTGESYFILHTAVTLKHTNVVSF